MKKVFLCVLGLLYPFLSFTQQIESPALLSVDIEAGNSPQVMSKLTAWKVTCKLRWKKNYWLVVPSSYLSYTPPNRPSNFFPSGFLSFEPKDVVVTTGFGMRYMLFKRPKWIRLGVEDALIFGGYQTHKFFYNPSNPSIGFSRSHDVVSNMRPIIGNTMGVVLEFIPFKYMAVQGSCSANLNTERCYWSYSVGICLGVLR